MKKFILVFFSQIFLLSAFSQDGFVPGYIINYNGDTIKGKIKDRKWPKNKLSWQKINFINDKGENDKFTADDIKEYSKKGSSRYISLALGVEGTKRFTEVLEWGSVILFSYSLGLSPNAPPEYFLQKKADVNSLMQWRDKDYKATAAAFFKDDKELMKLIESDSLKHSDIQIIVKKYNANKK